MIHKQKCRNFQYCYDSTICPKKEKGTIFIWVFILLGKYNLDGSSMCRKFKVAKLDTFVTC